MSAGTEVRYDALSDRTVIVATGRDARPHQFRAPDGDPDPGTEHCPFCPGHETMTPPEVARTGDGAPDTPGWRVRVVPNLYPIVDTHEVVVLSPDHYRPFGTLDDAAAIEVLTMLRDRVAVHLDHGLEVGHAAAVAILNHKREAGASLPHPHAQVLATDFVPPAIAAAVGRVEHAPTDLVLDDLAGSETLVLTSNAVNAGASAWCPFASSSPFQLRVASMRAGAHFDRASDEAIVAVALATRDALARLARALDDPPYNVVVHSAPPSAATFHWYVEITPRLSVTAGFEQATGLFVNTVDPAQAARVLNAARP
jgi:UDPglucose--hexose-1-phosphate uridylyltransferase